MLESREKSSEIYSPDCWSTLSSANERDTAFRAPYQLPDNELWMSSRAIWIEPWRYSHLKQRISRDIQIVSSPSCHCCCKPLEAFTRQRCTCPELSNTPRRKSPNPLPCFGKSLTELYHAKPAGHIRATIAHPAIHQ